MHISDMVHAVAQSQLQNITLTMPSGHVIATIYQKGSFEFNVDLYAKEIHVLSHTSVCMRRDISSHFEYWNEKNTHPAAFRVRAWLKL
jgi:small-conductance mechanosensitive channel